MPAARVRITDVSPRDGLQNEPGVIPTSDKIRLVQLLRPAGVDEIEVSSFVSAKWVPQLGDAAEVFAALASDTLASDAASPTLYSALVPNEKGLDAALNVNQRAGRRLISKVSVFTAASETFARKNTNATIAETLERFSPVLKRAHAEGLLVRGYISCVIACPFEGTIEAQRVIDVARRLQDLGVDELDYGDTIGAATPASTRTLLHAHATAFGRAAFDMDRFTLHLHDTFGRAADCVRAALDVGVRSFDASAAGLGGCPYASLPGKPAPGNINTETLVHAVHAAGFTTNINPEALREASRFARAAVDAARKLAT